MRMNLSNKRFPLHPWKLCTYHSQTRPQYLSDLKLIFCSLMTLENIYKNFRNLKMFTTAKL